MRVSNQTVHFRKLSHFCREINYINDLVRDLAKIYKHKYENDTYLFKWYVKLCEYSCRKTTQREKKTIIAYCEQIYPALVNLMAARTTNEVPWAVRCNTIEHLKQWWFWFSSNLCGEKNRNYFNRGHFCVFKPNKNTELHS